MSLSSLVSVAATVLLEGPVASPDPVWTQYVPERRVPTPARLEGVKVYHEERQRDAQGLLGLPHVPPQVVEFHRHTRVHSSVVRALPIWWVRAYIARPSD